MNSLVLLPFCFAAVLAGVAPYAAVAPYGVAGYGLARTQYHSQDSYGNYNYGYAEPNSAKTESRHADGTVTGSYTVPLPDGRVLTNNYVADEFGFRSSLAPTAAKDFAPVVKAAYSVNAPVLAHTVGAVAIAQPALHIAKSVGYAAPALVKSYAGFAAPALAYGHGAPAALGYGYAAPAIRAYGHGGLVY